MKLNSLLKKALLPAMIVSLLLFVGFLFTSKPSAPSVTFTTIEGKNITMASLKGKIVLVNFWATNCLSCIKEMPSLTRLYAQYHTKGFEIIAVAMPDDPPAQVLNYAIQKALPFPVMHDGLSEMTQKFGGVDFTPTSFIFNKQGKRLQYTIGKLDFVKLEQLLNTELNE